MHIPRVSHVASGWARLLLAILLVSSAGEVWSQETGDAALQRLAADLLPRVEALSRLEAKRPLNVARRSREAFQAVLQARLEEESAEELPAVEQVYKRLGLIPDTLDLTGVSGTLLGEQIAGYYDPRTDTLYVMEDVSAVELVPTLVHEMVHALQNQYFPLESLVDRERGSDRQMAARAAIEGHAMLVMWLFTAEEATGRAALVRELPDMTLVPIELFFPDRPMPELAAAPLILREGLIFPYARGAGFVQALWRREPGGLPFGPLLPQSTEQVLDPEVRFFDERDAPVEIIFDFSEIGGGGTWPVGIAGSIPSDAGQHWVIAYENTLGQFELSVLLRQRHYLVGSERFARGWGGDRYLLLSDGERQAVLWYLVWDDAYSASSFANAYRQILNTRLNRSGSVEELTIEGRAAVRIVDADEGVDLSTVPRLRLRVAPERI